METYLYLARHAEAGPDGSDLTERGVAQARALGARLSGVPLTRVVHGPLIRAARTAALVAGYLPGVPVESDEAAGDYLPWAGPGTPFDDFLDRFDAAERERGAALAAAAERRFTAMSGRVLVVTHNFLVAWLVRHALDAPPGRWLGLNQQNAALTVIRYRPQRPPALLVHNDAGHLPPELRWTGLPAELHV
jgi:probable phosphoglycerate mutase